MPEASDFTVGWICALPTELAAAQALLDERYHKNQLEVGSHSDDNTYELGRIGKHNVVIAVLPSYGLVNAATVAKDIARTFPNVRFALMVGVGGGVSSKKHDIRLGDVVVSCRGDGHGGVIQYDLGRALQTGEFQKTGSLNQPPQALLTALRNLEAHHDLHGHNLQATIDTAFNQFPRLRRKYAKPDPGTDRLYRNHVVHKGSDACEDNCSTEAEDLVSRLPRDEDEDDPAIFYGLIASANTVMKDACQRDKLAAESGVLCFEMEAAGLMNNIPCLVIRGISDYCDSHKQKAWQGYAAMTAAAYAKELLGNVSLVQVSQEEPVRRILDSVNENLLDVQSHVTQTRIGVDNLQADLDLSKLPAAVGASFDSQLPEYNALCLEDTRTELLEDIMTWVSNKDGKPIFWLSGMAGTGKSTLARTIAKHLEHSGKLGASFFFKRGEGDRAHAQRFFTTITRDLCAREPGIIPTVRKCLEENPRISESLRKDQFEKLILEPLRKLKRGSVRVIVIDALDECSQEDHAYEILSQLARTSNISPMALRIIVTSRPEVHIRLGFRAISNGTYPDLILHEVDKDVVKHDIEVFIRHELRRVRDQRQLDESWPVGAQISTLVNLATPLFIYASFICGYIGSKTGNPETQLKKVIELGKSTFGQLDQVYLQVLEELLAEQDPDDRSEWLADFRRIVGTIIVLQSPLSIRSLARLLQRSTNDLKLRLESFHSVLHVPEHIYAPVRTLHLSFRETLISENQEKDSQFWVNEVETHHMVAQDCISLMKSGLRENICQISSTGMPRVMIPTETIESSIPPELRYACISWVDHLYQSGERIIESDRVSSFLQKHFLSWLEVMGIIGESDRCVHLLEKLLSIVLDPSTDRAESPPTTSNGQQNAPDSTISDFLRDAVRFVLKFRSPLDEFPLQIYESGFVFSPLNSLVRQLIPNWAHRKWKLLTPIHEDWDVNLNILEGHIGAVKVVAFSQDGSLIASGSDDETVRLWETRTGIHRGTLGGHDFGIGSLAFSPDDQLLASADWSKVYLQKPLDDPYASYAKPTIRLWEVATKTCRAVLEIPWPGLGFFKFSPNGRLIVALCECENINMMGRNFPSPRRLKGSSLRIWSTETGKSYNVIQDSLHNLRNINDICFTPDSRVVVLASFDTLCLYEIDTGASQIFNESPKGIPTNLGQSRHHFNIVLSTMKTEGVRLWEVSSKACRSLTLGGLKGEVTVFTLSLESEVTDVCLSPDGKLLVAAFFDRGVRLWDLARVSLNTVITEDEEMWTKLQGLEQRVLFATDSSLFSTDKALFSTDLFAVRQSHRATPSVFNTSYKRYVELYGHSEWVTDAKFSPNGHLLVTASDDTTLRLWDLSSASGALTQSSTFPYNAVRTAVAPDGQLVAFASLDGTIWLWDTIAGSHYKTLVGDDSEINSMVFSADGHDLTATSRNGKVRVWNTGEKDQCPATLHNFEDHYDNAKILARSFDEQVFVLQFSHDIHGLWKKESGTYQQILEIQYSHNLSAINVSRTGNMVAFGSSSFDAFDINIWDSTKGGLRKLEGHTDRIRDLTFSPNTDGKLLASSSVDGTIRIWETDTGDFQIIRSDHIQDVYAITFSGDGKLLASACADGSIRLWNTKTYSCIATHLITKGWVKGDLTSPVSKDQSGLWNSLLQPGLREYRLAFSRDDSILYTWHLGDLKVPYELFEEGQRSLDKKRPAISVQNQWILLDSKPALWLPFEVRPDVQHEGKHMDVNGPTITLARPSGGYSLLRLADDD